MHKILTACLLIAAIVLVSCESSQKKEERFREIRDDLGRVIQVREKPQRVMALSSSITEILGLICPDSMIVGRTQNCNYPPRILSKPVVNNYPIDYEKLLLLKPDIVFGKDGIVSLEQAAKLESMGIPFYFQHYSNLNDIVNGIAEIGVVLKLDRRANEAADSLRKVIYGIRASTAGLKKPTVLFLISLDKIFVFGKDSYVTDVLEAAGGTNAINKVFNSPFPQVTSEYIMQIDPEVIIMGEKTDEALLATLYPEFKKLRALKTGRIYHFPGDLISRPGPRIGLAIQKIKHILHPDEK